MDAKKNYPKVLFTSLLLKLLENTACSEAACSLQTVFLNSGVKKKALEVDYWALEKYFSLFSRQEAG